MDVLFEQFFVGVCFAFWGFVREQSNALDDSWKRPLGVWGCCSWFLLLDRGVFIIANGATHWMTHGNGS